jgi:heme exporter protein D
MATCEFRGNGGGGGMNWGSVAEFFAMGGYAPYVWGSFAVVALCMLVETLAVRARRQRALHELRRAGAAALESRA